MAHLVESMFSVREVPWHGLGEVVTEAPESEEAIKLAGLDWDVLEEPVYVGGSKEKTKYIANVRSNDGSVLGIVSKRYRIVQNREAFKFTDELLGHGVKYETAGSLKNGEKVWLLAKAPEHKILGDKIQPFLCFMNTHNGEGAVRVLLTPIRVVCNNTLNLALGEADRAWSARHVGSLQDKIESARMTLDLADNYMHKLDAKANLLADKNISDKAVEELINQLLPMPEGEKVSKRQKTTVIDLQEELRFRYKNAPDLKRFRGTSWGFIGAVSDFVTHSEAKRQTKTYQERKFQKLVYGHNILDHAYKLVA